MVLAVAIVFGLGFETLLILIVVTVICTILFPILYLSPPAYRQASFFPWWERGRVGVSCFAEK